MNLQDQVLSVIKSIIEIDDKVLEKDYDDFITLFTSEDIIEKTLIEKLAYCKANDITEDDLIEENNITDSNFDEFLETLSPIKKKIFKQLIQSSININDKIISKGLFPKVNVRVEIINPEVELPTYSHENGDSGLDIKVLEDTIILPHSTIIVPTGLKVAIPLGYEIQIRPRSGNSLKYQNLFIANSPGTIDANYREEIGIILKNIGDFPIFIEKGSKIVQAVLCPVIKLQWVEVDDIGKFPTERKGGFGSTGA